MLLKKIFFQAKMRIEQFIKFKLRGPGPLSHYMYATPTTGYFHDLLPKHFEDNVGYFTFAYLGQTTYKI